MDVKLLIDAFTNQIQPCLVLGAEIDAFTGKTYAKTLTNMIAELHSQLPNLTWTNGMSQPDERGFVKLQPAEEVRQLALASNNPGVVAWAQGNATVTGGAILPQWFAIQDAIETFSLQDAPAFNVSANVANSRFRQAISGGNIMLGMWTAYDMTPTPGKLYDIGPVEPDACAFAGELRVGDKLYTPGVHVQDVKTALLSIMNLIGNSYLAQQRGGGVHISPN